MPIIVENVRGAQEWVGPAKWNHGSFYLWGDVPALMPITGVRKLPGNNGPRLCADREIQRLADARKVPGLDWSKFGEAGYKPQGFNVVNAQRYREGVKGIPHRTARHWTNPAEHDNGVKVPLSGRAWYAEGLESVGSKSDSRKAASAHIAKIPRPLAQWIARCFKPHEELFTLRQANSNEITVI